MPENNEVLMYKGHPLMRKDNLIYYGSMAVFCIWVSAFSQDFCPKAVSLDATSKVAFSGPSDSFFPATDA